MANVVKIAFPEFTGGHRGEEASVTEGETEDGVRGSPRNERENDP